MRSVVDWIRDFLRIPQDLHILKQNLLQDLEVLRNQIKEAKNTMDQLSQEVQALKGAFSDLKDDLTADTAAIKQILQRLQARPTDPEISAVIDGMKTLHQNWQQNIAAMGAILNPPVTPPASTATTAPASTPPAATTTSAPVAEPPAQAPAAPAQTSTSAPVATPPVAAPAATTTAAPVAMPPAAAPDTAPAAPAADTTAPPAQ